MGGGLNVCFNSSLKLSMFFYGGKNTCFLTYRLFIPSLCIFFLEAKMSDSSVLHLLSTLGLKSFRQKCSNIKFSEKAEFHFIVFNWS